MTDDLRVLAWLTAAGAVLAAVIETLRVWADTTDETDTRRGHTT